jgi:hypothetical protein
MFFAKINDAIYFAHILRHLHFPNFSSVQFKLQPIGQKFGIYPIPIKVNVLNFPITVFRIIKHENGIPYGWR